MIKFRLPIAVLILLVSSLIAQAQEKSPPSQKEGENISIEALENRINGQFQWRVIIPQNKTDSVPYKNFNTKSISFSIGGTFPLSRFLEFQIHPGFTFTKLRFKETADKTFPTTGSDKYVYEKIRSIYVSLPLGFQFNIIRGNEDEVGLHAEVGASAGYKISSSYKNKLKREDIKVKIPRVSGIEKLRYGIYTQVNYKWVGITAHYRLSDYFQQDQLYSRNNSTGLPQNDPKGHSSYPTLPPIELGLTFDF